jgi:hypothetical protein
MAKIQFPHLAMWRIQATTTMTPSHHRIETSNLPSMSWPSSAWASGPASTLTLTVLVSSRDSPSTSPNST